MTTNAGRNTAISAALGALLALAAPVESGAAEAQGAYVRADIGGSFARSPGGSVADGNGFSGDLGKSAVFELGAGYQLPYNLRAELTAGYRPNFAVRSRESLSGIPLSADAKLRTWTVMANAYYDIDTGTAFTPYVGAGAGVAFNRLNTVTYRLGAAEFQESGKNTSRFAWSVMAGGAYAVTSAIKLDLGYRYLDAGRFETSGNTTNGPVKPVKGDVRSHEIKLGLRYAF